MISFWKKNKPLEPKPLQESIPKPLEPDQQLLDKHLEELSRRHQLMNYQAETDQSLEELFKAFSSNPGADLYDKLEIQYIAFSERLIRPESFYQKRLRLLSEGLVTLGELGGLASKGELDRLREDLLDGKLKECLEFFDALKQKDSPKKAIVAFTSGRLAMELLEFDLAYENYSLALSIEPSNPHYYLEAGIASRITKRHTQAEDWFKKAVTLNKAANPDLPVNPAILYQLARLRDAQDQPGEAENLYLDALQIQEHRSTDSDTLLEDILLNLTGFYLDNQKPDQALEILRRIFDSAEKTLSHNHSFIGSLWILKGDIFQTKGDLIESENCYLKARAIYLPSLGENSPETAHINHCLALIYWQQQKLQDSENLFNLTVATYQKQLGGFHLKTAEAIKDLADFYKDIGDGLKAEELLKRALQITECHFGKDSLALTEIICSLGNLYHSLGGYSQAEEHFIRAKEIADKNYKDKHPYKAFINHTLADFYRKQNQHDKALPLYKSSIKIAQSTLGEAHPTTTSYMENLALLYQIQNQHQKTEKILAKVIDLKKTKFGKKHPELAFSLHKLGACHLDQNKPDKAEPILKQAQSILEKSFPYGHSLIEIIETNLQEIKRNY
ncbi:MAG: tetratricopeptide repeat protein [Deltaproteobacteria bacterium]|nr:tetratricopeptide repeat protein [Deltaproteobacteria bacterium]